VKMKLGRLLAAQFEKIYGDVTHVKVAYSGATVRFDHRSGAAA